MEILAVLALAGVAYLIASKPKDKDKDEEPPPITTGLGTALGVVGVLATVGSGIAASLRAQHTAEFDEKMAAYAEIRHMVSLAEEEALGKLVDALEGFWFGQSERRISETMISKYNSPSGITDFEARVDLYATTGVADFGPYGLEWLQEQGIVPVIAEDATPVLVEDATPVVEEAWWAPDVVAAEELRATLADVFPWGFGS